MSGAITYGSSALEITPQQTIPFDSTFLKAQEAKNYGKDNASKSFAKPNDMLEFLMEREDNAEWINEVDIRDLNVMLLEDATMIYRTASTEIVHDTAKNTGLVIQGGDLLKTALRSCAMPSLQERAKISGTALTKVSKLVLRNILNECLNVASDKATAKIRIADGKVSAVRSSDYVPLSIPEIFTATTEYINTRFPHNHFAGGNWSHVLSTAEFELSGERDLIKTYTEALEKRGIDHKRFNPAYVYLHLI